MSGLEKSDSILDRICIAMPCSMNWQDMQGNDEVRLCGGCNKSVYNISAMSKKQAEEILSLPNLPCIQICRNSNERIVTSDNPQVLRPLHSFWARMVSSILSAIAIMSPQLAAASDEKLKPSVKGRPTSLGTYVGGVGLRPGIGIKTFQKIMSTNTKAAVELFPTSLLDAGLVKCDLPTELTPNNVESFKKLKPDDIVVPKINADLVPASLDVESWTEIEKAREQHARACLFILNSQTTNFLSACKKARHFYSQALKKSEKSPFDPVFRSFMKDEQNKVESLERRCIRSYN